MDQFYCVKGEYLFTEIKENNKFWMLYRLCTVNKTFKVASL